MGSNYTPKNRALESDLRDKALFPNTSAPWQQKILDNLFSEMKLQENFVCLDAACGVGNNIETILRHFKKVVVFDKSERALEFAKNRHLSEKSDISFSVGNLENFSFESNSFDCVVCTEALEHVKNYDKVIEEIYRVTKPGGFVVVSFQNHFNLSAALKFILEKIYKKNWDAWGTHAHEEGYESYLSCFQIKKAVNKHGFISVKEFGGDYINAWLSWIPFFYRNYKILDKYPILFLGKISLIKYLGMDYFLLLKKHE